MNGEVKASVISVEDVKDVLSKLKTQREVLNNTFKNEIENVLHSSQLCFSIAGVDYSAVYDSFNRTFTQLDNRFESLIKVLDNGVIDKYSDLINAVNKMFNKDFGNQINYLLEINNKNDDEVK